MNAKQTAELIWERTKPFFKRIKGVAYNFYVVYNKYDQEFNIFFESVPMSKNAVRTSRRRSQPIHSMDGNDLRLLESTLNELTKLTKLSINMEGFAGMVWPITGKTIMKKNKNKNLTLSEIEVEAQNGLFAQESFHN